MIFAMSRVYLCRKSDSTSSNYGIHLNEIWRNYTRDIGTRVVREEQKKYTFKVVDTFEEVPTDHVTKKGEGARWKQYIATNNVNDIADSLYRGTSVGGLRRYAYYIDGPNLNFPHMKDSWDKLLSKHPDWYRKWVFEIPNDNMPNLKTHNSVHGNINNT